MRIKTTFFYSEKKIVTSQHEKYGSHFRGSSVSYLTQRYIFYALPYSLYLEVPRNHENENHVIVLNRRTAT